MSINSVGLLTLGFQLNVVPAASGALQMWPCWHGGRVVLVIEPFPWDSQPAVDTQHLQLESHTRSIVSLIGEYSNASTPNASSAPAAANKWCGQSYTVS